MAFAVKDDIDIMVVRQLRSVVLIIVQSNNFKLNKESGSCEIQRKQLLVQYACYVLCSRGYCSGRGVVSIEAIRRIEDVS